MSSPAQPGGRDGAAGGSAGSASGGNGSGSGGGDNAGNDNGGNDNGGAGPVGSGRVVAELGRPETPQETAARKAENSRLHRANQTTRNLVLALLASLAIVLITVLFVVRPDQTPIQTVNFRSAASQAQQGVSTHIASPALPKSWRANAAELRTGLQNSQIWYIGFITPKTQYIGLEEGIGVGTGAASTDTTATDAYFASLLGKAKSTGTVNIDGSIWSVYDQRDSGDVGNYEYSLTIVQQGIPILLHGSASSAEFATVATAVGKDLGKIQAAGG